MLIKNYNIKNYDFKKLKEKPLHAAIAGAVILIVLIIIFNLLFGGGESGKVTSTAKVKKGPLRISVTETGTIQAKEKIIVKNEVEGNTSIIFIVDEGTTVKKGDLLVELDSSNLTTQKMNEEAQLQNADAGFISSRENLAVVENQAKSDVDKAQLAFEFAKQDLEKYKNGEYPNQKMQAESKITLAEEEHKRAQEKYEWSKKLFNDKYLSQMELDADELAEKQKELNLKLAKNELDLLNNFTYTRQIKQLESDMSQAEMALERTTRKAKADIVQAEASLKAKEAELKQAKDKLDKTIKQLEKTKIYSPADGQALFATSAERGPRFGGMSEPLDEGSSVRERQELIHLPTTAGFIAEVGIYESSLDKVRTGLTTLITIDALPGEQFRGKVTSLSPVADAMSSFMNPDLKLYPAVIELENSEKINLIKSGMSCTAEIIVEQYPDAVYVPVQAVIRVDNKPTVFVGSGSNPKPRQVEIGLANNLHIHITKGLKEGEVVSLTPPLVQASMTTEPEEIDMVEGIANPPVNSSTQGMPQANMPQQGGSGNMGNMQMPSKDEMFKMSDADGDGKIVQSEFMMGEGQFKKMDKNGDGFIEATEFEIPAFNPNRANMPRTKEDFIKQGDKDGDNKVSKTEFMGPEEFFGNMDKNGDGFITIDEAPDPSSFGRGGAGGRGGMGGMPGGNQGGNFGFPGGAR
ncbi:MAG: efflux RND transporter periplasmic adaptor subunit [Deltaproteobacteria bacterium]|nr:efflux RND transporter periplasmic adaptor subunit [Deltaproteobacteria bacterium]